MRFEKAFALRWSILVQVFGILWCFFWFGALSSASYIITPSGTPLFPSVSTPSLVQSAKNQTAASPTSLSVSLSSLPAVGDILVIGPVTDSNTADASVNVTDNQNAAYVRLNIQPNSAGSSAQRGSLWCAAVVQSSGTYTITATVPTNTLIGIFALQYHNGSCNPDKLTGANTNSSPYSCGNFTTSNAKDILVTMLNIDGATAGPTFTAPSGFTIQQQQTNTAAGIPAAIADQITSATGSFTPTWASNKNVTGSPCTFVALLSK